MLKPSRPISREGKINQCPCEAVWQDVPAVVAVEHHTSEVMLQRGVAAEISGLLAKTTPPPHLNTPKMMATTWIATVLAACGHGILADLVRDL